MVLQWCRHKCSSILLSGYSEQNTDIRKQQQVMDLRVLYFITRNVWVQTYAHLSDPTGDVGFVPCNTDAHKNNLTNSSPLWRIIGLLNIWVNELQALSTRCALWEKGGNINIIFDNILIFLSDFLVCFFWQFYKQIWKRQWHTVSPGTNTSSQNQPYQYQKRTVNNEVLSLMMNTWILNVLNVRNN